MRRSKGRLKFLGLVRARPLGEADLTGRHRVVALAALRDGDVTWDPITRKLTLTETGEKALEASR